MLPIQKAVVAENMKNIKKMEKLITSVWQKEKVMEKMVDRDVKSFLAVNLIRVPARNYG